MSQQTNSRPGRGWFLTATILLGVTGILHTIGQFGGEEPELAGVLDAMRQTALPMGFGMSPSIYAIFRDLAFTMSVTFFALTAMNLVFVFAADATTRLRRIGAAINLVWLGVFIALELWCRVPPPLICAVVVWPVFLIAFVKSK